MSLPESHMRHYGTGMPTLPQDIHFGAKEIGWHALGPAIACTALATFAVAFRWYTRRRISRCLGLDDWVILFSMMLGWSMCAIIGAELNEGLGVYRGRTIDAPHLAKLVIINNDLWALAVNITKASIIAQYLRIFSGRKTRICCFVILFLLLPATCWAIFGGTFLCTPVAKLWSPQLPGHCMNAQTYWLSAAGANICLDFLVLILPLPAITALRLPRRQKICLVLVFLLGFFVCVVSIVRLATVFITAHRGLLVESGVQAITWSAVEANVGITCACLVALKPLLAKCCPWLLEEEGAVPEHCMHLPMVQTSFGTAEESGPLCYQSTNTASSPSTVPSQGSISMLQRASVAGTLPDTPQVERLSFIDMLTAGHQQERGVQRGA